MLNGLDRAVPGSGLNKHNSTLAREKDREWMPDPLPNTRSLTEVFRQIHGPNVRRRDVDNSRVWRMTAGRSNKHLFDPEQKNQAPDFSKQAPISRSLGAAQPLRLSRTSNEL